MRTLLESFIFTPYILCAGGGVMGAAGRLAALAALKKLQA